MKKFIPQMFVVVGLVVWGSVQSSYADVTVFATPVTSNGSSGVCPGSYAGYVYYTKTVANGCTQIKAKLGVSRTADLIRLSFDLKGD